MSGEYGGSRGSEVKGRRRQGAESEDRRSEWEKKGRKNSWGREEKVREEKANQVDIRTERKREIGNNGLQHTKGEKEESKNEDMIITVVKLKILTKNGENFSSLPMGLFPWHQIQVLALLTGAFLVSLSLLQGGMLGCVAMDVTHLTWTA
jgi:hypothetical protein